LTAAPAVQRYPVAPAEAILPLPIKNQSSTIVNRQFLPQLGRKRISTKMEVAVDDVLFLTTKGSRVESNGRFAPIPLLPLVKPDVRISRIRLSCKHSS